MSLKCGIIGLPNVGKSTLFNALTATTHAQVANYPFCTIEPNYGVAIIPDKRLQLLSQIFAPPKIVPGTIEFVDIAGLVKGASKGEGLGNQFLSHIREVDAIIHIVRCFESDNIIHVYPSIDPKNDIEVIETELILKDIETVQKKIEKIIKIAKTGDRHSKTEIEILQKIKKHLEESKSARHFSIKNHKEEENIISDLNLLTSKPVLFVSNVNDENISGNKYSDVINKIAREQNAKTIIISAESESEIAQLTDEDERKEFLESLGLQESGLARIIKGTYELLNLITFYTVNEKELHSWIIKNGTKVHAAAGKIHTDFEKGFIRAEVIKSDDILKHKSEHVLREKGLIHIEGKDYLVSDGDIIYIRFNI